MQFVNKKYFISFYYFFVLLFLLFISTFFCIEKLHTQKVFFINLLTQNIVFIFEIKSEIKEINLKYIPNYSRLLFPFLNHFDRNELMFRYLYHLK